MRWAESKGGAKPGASKHDIASLEPVRNLIMGEIQLMLEGRKKYEVSSYWSGGSEDGCFTLWQAHVNPGYSGSSWYCRGDGSG